MNPALFLTSRFASHLSLAFAAALVLNAVPLQAATPALSTTNASAQDTINALTKAQAAVVGVQVIAADGARSAQTLGKARSGSGVVIGSDGLIVTIGYLILEADQIQITTVDKKTVPAQVVAYDLATGFGLIRPVVPLRGIAPVPLGASQVTKTGESLMVSTGASSDDDADVGMTQLVSKRAFSGYWEYHIGGLVNNAPSM